MEEVISMAVANGLWAVLFCVLLGYELRDSRKRESRYTATIGTLAERLGTVGEIRADTKDIRSDAEKILDDTETIKAACTKRGRVCAKATQ